MPNATKTPGSQIDTGTGGFSIDGQRQSYDVGSPGDPAVPPVQWSGGEVKVDNDVKDISKSSKVTLASYLSQTTLGKGPSAGSAAPNKFPVPSSSAGPLDVSLNDAATGVPIGPQKTSNESSYASGYVPGDERSPSFEKAKTTKGSDGNRLLRDYTKSVEPRPAAAVGTGKGFSQPVKSSPANASSPINEYYGSTSSPLSNSVIYNRFNADSTFVSNSGFYDRQYSVSYPMGQSLDPEDPRRSVSFGRLAQVGNVLSIRSGLELNSLEAGENPTGGGAQGNALLPGMTQLGIKRIGRSLLEAKDVLDTLTNTELDGNILMNPGELSWGSLNNVQDQYAGISNFGMQLLAAALVIGVCLIFSLFIGLFSLVAGGGGSTAIEKNIDQLHRKPYGAYRSSASGGDYSSISGIIKAIFSGEFNLWRLLGFASTSYPMERCIAVGGLAFFGVSSPNTTISGMAKKAVDAALSVTMSPGYYSVMARNVSRSFLIISDSFSSLGKAFGSGITAGIKQLLEVIDVLRTSKFIRALNIFAKLGDTLIAMSSKDTEFDKDSNTNTPYTRFMSDIDNSENIDAVSKSRLKVDKDAVSPLTLAWASYRSPDLFVMPVSIMTSIMTGFTAGVNGKDKMGVPLLRANIPIEAGGKNKGGLKYGYVPLEDTVDRIPTEVREKMEDALESEYVPFYFHDVRTNEILSFHAFLASLSDGYTASYDSSDGFGRVEPIKVYKSTARKIDFSFYVAATNPDDFDYMWSKINKLTTMVYPQYTEGRSVSDAGGQNSKYSIHVPFSQTIAASPMVRVRIGDLVRSNYSKFNLARLFGYASRETKFGGKSYGSAKSDDLKKFVDEQEKLKGAKDTLLFMSGGELGLPVPKPGAGAVPVVKPSSPTPTDVKHLPPGFALKVMAEPDENGMITVQVVEASAADVSLTPDQITERDSYKDAKKGDSKDILGKYYKVPKQNVVLTPSYYQKAVKAAGASSDAVDYYDAASNFMSDDLSTGNAVSRSFRSSGGKGLAGFIESLSFDWYDKVTWEIGRGTSDPGPTLGRRAPKMCKVTVIFSPIHDISPGIDNKGMNRAPVYPVGPFYVNDLRQGDK